MICVMLASVFIAAGCRDAANRKANPDDDAAPVADPYELGRETADQFVTDYLSRASDGLAALAERYEADAKLPADKREMPNGKARADAFEKITTAARKDATAKVNKAAEPILNERPDDLAPFTRGYVDGLKRRL